MASVAFPVTLHVVSRHFVTFPVTLHVGGNRSVTTDTTWTPLDETGVMVGIRKNENECTPDFAKRVQTASNAKLGPGRDGVMSGLVMETGFNLQYWASLYSPVSGAYFEVTPDYIHLVAGTSSQFITFMDVDPTTGEITDFTLADLASQISALPNWTITILNADLAASRAYMLPVQSSKIQKESYIEGSTFTKLDKNIVQGTFHVMDYAPELLNEVSVDAKDDMTPGDYCIDYVSGGFFCYDAPTYKIRVLYEVSKLPYLVAYSPFALIPLNSGLYQYMSLNDGTPCCAAEKIIYRMLTKGTRTHWSSK